MPLYEYRCAACDHRFEVLQRMGEGSDGLRCPQCDRERLDKQFSTFAASMADSMGDRGAGGFAPCGMPQQQACCQGAPT
jgi:putative FmdB family regulatory protein